MNKKQEDQKIKELLMKISKMQKEAGFKPKEFKTSPDGTILLDPTDKNDREWYENDEEYGGYE